MALTDERLHFKPFNYPNMYSSLVESTSNLIGCMVKFR